MASKRVSAMIEIQSLKALTLSDLKRVASGYSSDSKYIVLYTNAADHIAFDLQLVTIDKPYVKHFDYDDDTVQRYERLLDEGYSFGAYDENLLVGLVIGEPYAWNRSLWVPEFHVIDTYRNLGIGRQLMECVAEQARREGFRTIVCETQNTNVAAIRVYRRLGFELEGTDISYYTNEDYPDGEIAVFMKRRLQ